MEVKNSCLMDLSPYNLPMTTNTLELTAMLEASKLRKLSTLTFRLDPGHGQATSGSLMDKTEESLLL